MSEYFMIVYRGQFTFRILLLNVSLLAFVFAPAETAAQVSIAMEADAVTIQYGNAGRGQRAIKSGGINQPKWTVLDDAGAGYQACMSTCTQRDGQWFCEGYSSADRVAPDIVAGYAAALQYLVDMHGAVVEYDLALGGNYVSFPEADDPYMLLLDVLLNEYLDGRPLVEYFKSIEMVSLGVTGETYVNAKPRGREYEFPNDEFYSSQWGLQATKLAQALWHPFTPKLDRAVRVAVIDSGINESDAGHVGLDGVQALHHRRIAHTTGEAFSHGLSVVTLLADAANDGNGPVGLLGNWGGMVCNGTRAVFERQPVQLFSYNVGDFGPVSLLVAKAILAAIDEDVDIINLSLRIAYSPSVHRAIDAALAAGIVVVAAAGNFHPGAKTKATGFPASIDGVISVSSADRGRNLSQDAANSGFDILAPGVDIIVGGPGSTWRFGSGSSFAAPYVVAAVSLMKAARPEVSSVQAETILTNTAQKGPGGVRFLDALAALNALLPATERTLDIVPPEECTTVGKSTAVDAQNGLPEQAALYPNYPNPFNPQTLIQFSLPATQHVRLTVFDLAGREVIRLVEGLLEKGEHSAVFDASTLSAGVYFARLEANGVHTNAKMLLLK